MATTSIFLLPLRVSIHSSSVFSFRFRFLSSNYLACWSTELGQWGWPYAALAPSSNKREQQYWWSNNTTRGSKQCSSENWWSFHWWQEQHWWSNYTTRGRCQPRINDGYGTPHPSSSHRWWEPGLLPPKNFFLISLMRFGKGLLMDCIEEWNQKWDQSQQLSLAGCRYCHQKDQP